MEDCEPGDQACILDVQLPLDGTFTGIISPPANGTAVLDGTGVLGTSSCDFALVLAFNGAGLDVSSFTIDFPT